MSRSPWRVAVTRHGAWRRCGKMTKGAMQIQLFLARMGKPTAGKSLKSTTKIPGESGELPKKRLQMDSWKAGKKWPSTVASFLHVERNGHEIWRYIQYLLFGANWDGRQRASHLQLREIGMSTNQTLDGFQKTIGPSNGVMAMAGSCLLALYVTGPTVSLGQGYFKSSATYGSYVGSHRPSRSVPVKTMPWKAPASWMCKEPWLHLTFTPQTVYCQGSKKFFQRWTSPKVLLVVSASLCLSLHLSPFICQLFGVCGVIMKTDA